MIIDKYGDTITTINVDNENFDSINSYIAKDFKNGDKFSLKIMDNGISSQLKQLYTSKFNQGYLYKILEHKGINGSGNIHGEGIQVGYVDSAPSDFPYTSSIDPSVQTPSNVFCYGNDANTVNSDTIILKSNTLTKKIWPIESTFGHIDFVTSSNTNYPYTSMQNLSTFINSMLIPIASESQYRLFGTFNLGQPILPANYDLTQNLGIKSISTVEFDIASGSYFVTSSLHDQISGSSDMLGFGKPLIRPDHAVIPIMQGPNDIITDKKLNANVTWPGNGGDTGGTHSGATDIQLQFYFSGNAEQHALYQISYLEEKQVIIADIDKPSELTNDIGEKGYILIPDNLDKDIKDNLDYFLNRAGFEDDEPERIPNAKE